MSPKLSAVTRSGFFGATAGLVLSGQFRLLAQGSRQEVSLNAWVRIASGDTVTLIASQAEMGQGAITTLPAVLAEELGADWGKVRTEPAPVNVGYRNPRVNWQFTGNSESTTGFFDLLRKMGASAREMLKQAAAAQWNVSPADCVAENGFVVHHDSGRRLRFGELAEAASKIKPPENLPLKQPSEWKLLGRSLGRLEMPSKINGFAVFGMDYRMPGLLYAATAMPPVIGGKLKRFDRTPGVSMPGVVEAVELPDGIAIVADSYWRARKALSATPIEWDSGPNAARPNTAMSSASLMAQYQSAMNGSDWIRVKLVGQRPATGTDVTADYKSQFMAHATMEPMNCTAGLDERRSMRSLGPDPGGRIGPNASLASTRAPRGAGLHSRHAAGRGIWTTTLRRLRDPSGACLPSRRTARSADLVAGNGYAQ